MSLEPSILNKRGRNQEYISRFKIWVRRQNSWSLEYQSGKVVLKDILLLIKISIEINHHFWHFDFKNGIFLQLYTKNSQKWQKKVTKKIIFELIIIVDPENIKEMEKIIFI